MSQRSSLTCLQVGFKGVLHGLQLSRQGFVLPEGEVVCEAVQHGCAYMERSMARYRRWLRASTTSLGRRLWRFGRKSVVRLAGPLLLVPEGLADVL